MPKSAAYTLFWSAERNSYGLFTRHNREAPVLIGDDDAWFVWLASHTSFSFHGKQGSLSFQKEERPRGREAYWYAYRRQGKRMIKKYAGRSTDLSMARLEDVALALDTQTHRANMVPASAKEGSQRQKQRAPFAYQAEARAEASEIQHEPPLPLIGSLEQSDVLLMPKLRPPRLHTSLISRERLLKLLDAGLEHQLILLSAPAGFGKTTLVRSWMAARDADLPPVAWVALDAGDNDPLRFWHYLIAACQAFQEDLGSTALTLLRAAQQPPFPQRSLEGMLTALLNELARLPGRGILVLEDYHVITASEIHQAMSFFIEHLPATLHLIVITRADPPLPLARLRAHGDLVELGAAQLHFTREETRAFLRQTLPFPLEDTILDRLLARTEGWATGLRLITLALLGTNPELQRRYVSTATQSAALIGEGQGQMSAQEMEQWLSTISGSQRHILEYLVAEVLSAQAEPLQTFLLQTAGLSRLTSSLCDAVTGRDNSAFLLEQIEHANLFLIPLEGTGQWYRYHALFAEAMQYEARRRLGEEALRKLSSKASRWYERPALLDEAIESALAAEETERAAALITHLIEAQGFNQITEFQTLLRWITPLPEEILRRFPTLSQTYAMLLLFSADKHTPTLRSQIEHYLRLAESSLQGAGNLPRLGEVLALRSLAVGRWNEFDAALRFAGQALDLLPASETFWRSSCLIGVGVANLLAGRLNEALPAIQEARAIVEVAGNSYAIRATLFALGNVYLGQGKLHRAAELFRQMLDTAGDDRSDRGAALAGLATLSYEWNELTAAEQEAKEAYALSRDLGNELLLVLVAPTLARILHARGQTAEAQDILQRLTAYLTQPRWQREIETYQAWLAFASGDLASVERWAASHQAASPEESLTEAELERETLLLARWLLAQGKACEALDSLGYWRLQAQSQARMRSELEILLLMAQAHAYEQRVQEAKQALTEALALAHPAGYQRLFLDEGEKVASLLKTVLPDIRGTPLATYIRSLLRAFAHERSASTSATTPALIEPLSPQERRVLRLLVAGRSNPEIARELVVSINTVKAQVKSIYCKLDVGSRLEASDVARHLRLL
jgi:LuxR family transcriptional regulator, maltose regulon positive regulatory protein